MQSERLLYRPLDPGDLDAFHSLVVDPYVYRYLMDGQILPRAWSAECIRTSQELRQKRGVGLWLATLRADGRLVGFCGFRVFEELHPEPQLVYALREEFAGHGVATEMARCMIADARRAGFSDILAGVDAVNTASARVLDKLGFTRISTHPGAFGDTYLLRLAASLA